jgi:hypothetical protein
MQLTIAHALGPADLGDGLDAALDRYVAWGIKSLDLGGAAGGKGVLDCSEADAQRIAAALDRRGLAVHGLTTPLFGEPVEAGEAVFRDRHAARIEHALRLAGILRPQTIGLQAAATERRRDLADALEYVDSQRPWLLPMYRDAIARIGAAGLAVTIANHAQHCILSAPPEVQRFFAALAPARALWAYDAVDLWQMGTFPTVEGYGPLAGWVGSYHVKGGLAARRSETLCWRSGLADASWPVVAITAAVLADGRCPTLCLEAPRGHRKPGYDYTDLTARDAAFLRTQFPALQ